MDSKMEQREMISALADGQLRGEAFAKAVEAAAADPDARQAWQAYHLIGDVLRTGQAGTLSSPQEFLDKLSQRLALEAPIRPVPAAPAPAVAVPVRPAANDGSFRWKMVAGFASVAAVAAVGWTVVTGTGTGTGAQQPQLAGVTAPQGAAGATVAAGTQGVMIRDARLDEILEAHRQFGGASALQMPAGFLRNATFEGASR